MLLVARLQDRIPAVAELQRFVLYIRRSGDTAREGGGATTQLNLPSQSPVSVAACGRLQLGVLQLAASVHYCK